MASQPQAFLLGPGLASKIKETIARVDGTPVGGGGSRIPTALSGDMPRSSRVFRVCTADGEWALNAVKEVKYYGVTSTPNTVSVINKLVSLPPPKSTASSRIVNIAKDGTQWYLVSFAMSTQTVVLATTTQTMSFISSASTSQLSYIPSAATSSITYIASAYDVTVVTGVSARLNTANCTVVVDSTTANIKAAGPSQTSTILTSAESRTAAIISIARTQTAVLTAGTFTATIVSLEM